MNAVLRSFRFGVGIWCVLREPVSGRRETEGSVGLDEKGPKGGIWERGVDCDVVVSRYIHT